MTQITCFLLRLNKNYSAASDNLSIYYRGKRVWKKENKQGEATELKVKIPAVVGQTIDLDLYHSKHIFFKEKIGAFRLTIETLGGPFDASCSRAEYRMEWLVF